MGASLLALAKSLYYRRAYKQAFPTQRFLPGEPLSSPQSSRRLVMTAPPPKIFPEFAQVGLHASGSWGDWTVHITTSQFFYTLLHNNDFFDLYSTPQADFQSTVKKYTWFYYSIIPKTFVTTACKFNSSRKFSLFFTRYIPLQPPLSLNFAIKLWTPYFQGILGMFSLFSLYLFVCVYFSYKTLSLLRN